MIKRNVALLSVTIIAVLGLGALASIVGNVGIRRISSQDSILLLVSEPAVPGISTLVHWNHSPEDQLLPITIAIQGKELSQDLANTTIKDGAVSITVPCTLGDQTVGLIMKNSETEELISWRELNVLPAGPDCF